MTKYEDEYCKNMEYVESYENCIQLKQAIDLTSLFPAMFNWIDEKMNFIDEIWMLVHQNYVMNLIIQKLDPF